jgi:type II secretory pathway predicted ATPase ExeA
VPAEVALYVSHRLQVAGGSGDLFTPEAIARIAEVTKGVPRSINILCDTALVYGFSAEATTIEAALVDEVLQDRSEYGVMQPVT